MNPEAGEDFIWRLFDGELSPDEFAKLERSLEESPEARDRFLEQVDLHNLLGQKLCTPESLARSVQGPVSMDRLIRRERSRAAKYALLAAAAALVLLGVVFKLIFVKEPVPLVTFRTGRLCRRSWKAVCERDFRFLLDLRPKTGRLAG